MRRRTALAGIAGVAALALAGAVTPAATADQAAADTVPVQLL